MKIALLFFVFCLAEADDVYEWVRHLEDRVIALEGQKSKPGGQDADSESPEEKKNLAKALDTITAERDELKRRLCELSGWQTFGSSCYYISTEKKTWEQSRQWCSDKQSDLIIINSNEEQDFVNNRIQNVWLGLTDRHREGEWKWVDGSPLTSTPTYWKPDQPNNYGGGEDCAEHHTGEGWYDRKCTDTYRWMCEK